MSYKDDVKIFLNIMAQSPDGLADPQLIGKFSKAKAQLHAMSSMADMQAQNPAPQVANPNAGGTIPPAVAQDTAQEPLGANMAQNQPLAEPTQNG